MKLEQILKVAVRGGASDVLLKAGQIPKFRHNGNLVALQEGIPISQETLSLWIGAMIPKHLIEVFDKQGEVDYAYESSFGSRFRVNCFKQRQQIGMVLRVINSHVKTVEELQLPSICNEVAFMKRGLVLVTGATGSGKTTTLASIIQKINIERQAHVITIEDPIEYLYKEANSTINQREVGIDTDNFAVALRAALRQNPDVIMVGELRDKETTETALMAAETGHLVLSTLHTLDAVDSLNRILSYFDPHQHTRIRSQLSATLKIVLAQRLIPRVDMTQMIPAIEIMVVNEMIKNILHEGENLDAIHDAIHNGVDSYGMKSFDHSVADLFERGLISENEALLAASSPSNLRLLMSGVGSK